MGKVLDFDRARNERRDPTILKAFGGEYPIPSGPPVGFTLYAQQLSEEKSSEDRYTEEEMSQLLEYAVGSQTFNALMRNGLELDDIDLLIAMIGALWRGEDEGEGPAPAEGAGSATSENTGES